jgi:PKD repeat protein
MWGLSPSDNNAQINNYKAQYGVTNPCAGTEGGGPEAIDITIAGQNFLGYPTYCIVCPDRTLYFDVCWPPTAACFDPFIESCQPALAAGFSADPETGCTGAPVSYTDESLGNPTSWEWTFEGGDPATSTDQNPVVTYNTAGDWDVSLSVSDGTNSNEHVEEDFMSVFEVPDVSLEPLDTACLNWAPYELTGGMPEGGVYSGPGVVDNMFDPSAAGLGTHTITYTYEENGCENHAESEIVVDICAGIKEFNADNIRIYPNPSNGNFTLYLNYMGKAKISVYNLLGETIYQEEVMASGQHKTQIALQGIPEGLYLIAVQAGEEKYLQKVKITR